jgi:hypothetical protein
VGAASSEAPMTLAVRCTSRAPVTTRRAARMRATSARAPRPASRGRLREVLEVDRGVLAGVTLEPDLLHGEDQDGGEPGGQAVEEVDEHGAGGAAAGRVAVAVERVLADVEVERRRSTVANSKTRGTRPGSRRRRSPRARCGRARRGGGGPSARARASGRGSTLSASVTSPGSPAGSAWCCAGGGSCRRSLSGSRGRCGGRRCSRTARPRGEDVGAVVLDTWPGATVLPSDLDIFMPFSSSVKPWVRTPR